MKGLFNYDGTIMSFFGKLADLIWLNVLMIIFSIPIVTIGAVQTAGHYAALKLKRDEGHVFQNFWKSFKLNFKQSTIIWVILLVLYAVNAFAIFVSNGSGMPMSSLISGILLAAVLFVGIMNLWVYPLQCRFDNKISHTIRNAFFMGFRHIFRSIYMAICYALPIALVLLWQQTIPLILLLGMSAPIYLNVLAYNKVFEKLEEQILGMDSEENEENENEEIVEIASEEGEAENDEVQPQLPGDEA